MKRKIENDLREWKKSPNRKPLLLRGARQVGKTHVIRNFAASSFEKIVEINFEFQPEYKKFFETLDPHQLIKNISTLQNTQIKPGTTLLFLDEIQECPRAIMALRYFYEKMPSLQVIAAGSLLEFALDAPDFKMPVGRVQYAFLHPLSFQEFLQAVGEKGVLDWIDELKLKKKEKENEVFHVKALTLLKNYFWVGGMPAAVKSYVENKEGLSFEQEQLSILQTYRDDFGKYASRAQVSHLEKVFSTAPQLVGLRYKYHLVDPETRSRELKEALYLLARAGVVKMVNPLRFENGQFIPSSDDRKFKIIFLDVGLMQKKLGMGAELVKEKDLLNLRSGASAEQFVGQELLAYKNPFYDPELYFWARDEKNSQAEVDFVFQKNGQTIPIEVKAGSTGHLKSLHLFKNTYKSKIGIRFSTRPLSLDDGILSIPLYAVSEMNRLVKEVLN